MKKQLLFLVLSASSFAYSQTTILSENFDNYADGDWASAVSTAISSWDGTVGSAPDCQITSSQSSSPSNSISITGPAGANGGTIDPVVVFPQDYSTGRYLYSMKYLVASGKGAYFNAQSSYVPGVAWMCDVHFAADGTGYADAGGQTMNFTYSNGAWIDVEVYVDLDLDQGELIIEGSSVGTFVWSLESTGMGTGTNNSFGGVNLFALSGDPVASCEYYVDDISLVNMTGVGIEELNSGLDKTVVKILDLTGREVQFSPNKLLIYVYDDGTARKVFQVSK
jgi:hypothetical protein